MRHGSVRSTRAFVFYGAVVLLVVVLVGGTGASLLTPLVGWVTMDRSDPRFVHDLVVSTVLLVAFLAAVVQLVRPAQHVVAALSLGAVVTGIAGVVLLTGGPTSILLLPVLAALVLALHPADSVVPRVADASPSRRRLLLVAGGVLPLVVYGGGQLRRLLGGADADAAFGAGSGGGMAIVALTAVVVSALAVTGTPGRRFGTWSAGLIVGTLGLASLLSGMASGVGPVWGTLAVAWAVVFVVTDALETRDVAVTETPEARGGRVDAFRHSSRHHRRDRESAGRGDGVDRSR